MKNLNFIFVGILFLSLTALSQNPPALDQWTTITSATFLSDQWGVQDFVNLGSGRFLLTASNVKMNGYSLYESLDYGHSWKMLDQKTGVSDEAKVIETPDQQIVFMPRKNNDQSKTWGLIRSRDLSGLWSDQSLEVLNGVAGGLESVTLTSDENILVTGFVFNYNLLNRREGVVLKSSDQGKSFAPINFMPDCDSSIIKEASDKSIWKANRCYFKKDVYTLILQVSEDGGAHFTNMDTVEFDISGLDSFWSAQIKDIIFDPQGRVYYSISGEDAKGMHWVVRTGKKDTETGWKWESIDDQTFKKGHLPTPHNLTLDLQGSLYVCGDYGWPTEFVVRKTSDGGKTWVISDYIKSTKHLSCEGMFTDKDGTIYTLGSEEDVNSFVRKLKP